MKQCNAFGEFWNNSWEGGEEEEEGREEILKMRKGVASAERTSDERCSQLKPIRNFSYFSSFFSFFFFYCLITKDVFCNFWFSLISKMGCDYWFVVQLDAKKNAKKKKFRFLFDVAIYFFFLWRTHHVTWEMD